MKRCGSQLGMAMCMVVCCGISLLVLTVPGLALLTGNPLVIGAAVVTALVLIGVIVWRRRSAHCSPESVGVDPRGMEARAVPRNTG